MIPARPTALVSSICVAFAAVGCAMLGGGDSSSSELLVTGPVESAMEACKATFVDLDIRLVDSSMVPFSRYGLAVGVAASGSRVTVAMYGNAQGQTRVVVTSDSPPDPETQGRVLGGIQRRL